MKLKKIITASTLALCAASPSLMAADALSGSQKKEVEQIIHNYLVSNPEVLVEASQSLQEKQQKSMQLQAKSAIEKNADQLFNAKLAVAGNPNGNVTLVEFFDYQCIHCKKMKPVVSELIKKDKNLRVIYKEFPIFGKTSELASKAALAAAMQGKYDEMQSALLSVDKRLNENLIMEKAKSIGLDMNKFKKDMDSSKAKEILEENRKLAENIHLMGTPAFVVAATPNGKYKKGSEPAFIPGAASQETLQDLIEKAGH